VAAGCKSFADWALAKARPARHTDAMKSLRLTCLMTLCTAFLLQAQVKLPELKTPLQTYTNVTILSVSATDVNFKHSLGLANAKLRDLEPDMQKLFKYDPAKAGEAAGKQSAANAEYRRQAAAQKPVVKAPQPEPDPKEGPDVEIRVGSISAKSIKGQAAPPLEVEKWLTGEPDTGGKFVLVDFWATWCGPCRQSIPHLNNLAKKFGDQLVVIGLSNEKEADVNAMKTPKMNYTVAIDTQARMKRTLAVSGIPHALIIDPNGIVRFEGHPAYLTDAGVATLLRKYGN